MPLVRMDTLLRSVRDQGYALPAFECWDSNSIHAIALTARRLGVPAIFQASPTEYGLCGGADALAEMVRWYVKRHDIQAALHLDHGSTLEHVQECIAAGFTSVMIDASRALFDDNAKITREAVAMAGEANVSVEAELGHVAGAEAGLEEIAEYEAALTDPEEAARFVEMTGCHCLAVAIGTVHGVYRGAPNIRTDRLAAIVRRVEIPIVLHGGSGTPPETVRECIGLGVTKVNICTELQGAWLDGIAAAREELTISVPGLFYGPPFEALLTVMREKYAQFGAPKTHIADTVGL